MGEVTVCCFGHIQNYRGGGGGGVMTRMIGSSHEVSFL